MQITMGKIVCRSCKENKSIKSFPAGHLATKKYFMVCSDCREYDRKSPKTSQQIQQAMTRYKQMVEQRSNNSDLKIQESLLDTLEEQLGGEFNADATSFTESEELDNMMEKYEHDLIKVLSGLEEQLPDWYGLETEEEDD